MADMMTPPVRIGRITTRRMHTQMIQCPLDPEMLVAEFAGELPPDIARHVREHLLFCETCSARSRALQAPYQLLASLGGEPAPYVADLRDSVRVKVRSRRALHDVARFTARMGRGGAIALTGLLGLAVICIFLAVAFLFPAIAGVTARSQNALTHVPSAAPSGVLYAETNKLIPVTDRAGATWQVAEVIAVNQHTGAVVHSLPASDGTLRIASANQLPVATQVGGQTIVELTAPGNGGRQALVGFDATTGKVLYVTPLALPDGRALPNGVTGASLALAPDDSLAYVGLMASHPRNGDARVLVVDMASGAITTSFAPDYDVSAPMPPPPGSLPVSAFPSVVPHLDTSGMNVTTGLHGAIALSPDGAWLFDVLTLTGPNQQQYALVRRFSATTGEFAWELALPGDFSLAQLVANTNPSLPEVYLVSGSPDAHVYILDASTQGPTLTGDVPLGGPFAPQGTVFTGSLHLSLSPTGDQLYITQDATSSDGETTGHDVWIVDVRGMAVAVHNSATTNVGVVLPNTSLAKGALAFTLRGGVVSVTDSQLTGALTPWFQLSDGKPVIQLLATSAG